MMRKKQRHHRPKKTNILVTILPKAAIRPIVDVHRRRWSVERLVEELLRATGWGAYHVTKEPHRDVPDRGGMP
jgi:hypothetical protein